MYPAVYPKLTNFNHILFLFIPYFYPRPSFESDTGWQFNSHYAQPLPADLRAEMVTHSLA